MSPHDENILEWFEFFLNEFSFFGNFSPMTLNRAKLNAMSKDEKFAFEAMTSLENG